MLRRVKTLTQFPFDMLKCDLPRLRPKYLVSRA